MPQEVTQSDLKNEIVERDSNGELIAEDYQTQIGGNEVVVKHKPITTGLLNEISAVDDAIADLEPEAVYEAFQAIYLSDAILSLTVNDIRDMKAPALNRLLKPLEEKVEREFDGEEGGSGGNPMEMDRQERAREMR